ncbi:MAG: hypothetical protein NTU81_03465 [Candidatus Nomurabacteria bacterium]|nr:hypothetical protein [Candidatus Nomurabacteria bacterium]
MPRIILEDIKLNNKKKVLPKKEEPIFIETKNIQKDFNADNLKDSKFDNYFNKKSPVKQKIRRTPYLKNKIGGSNRLLYVFLGFIFIAVLVYFGGIYFQKADITITPKHQLINYNNKPFNILKESNGETDDIMVMIYTDKVSKKMILTEPKDVSVKSAGSVVLYNEFSAKPQKIPSGTFIADNEGKTYKTESAITIPGYTTENKKNIPGQITINLSAFLPGDTYNGSPTDFYITSYKGTTKYNKIYGKLKSPFVGGALGTVYTFSDMDIKNIDELAKTSLRNDIFKKVQSSVYPGYILYPDASTFSYKVLDNNLSKTPESEVQIEGTLSVILIKEKSLINNIIKISLSQITGVELKEINISDLSKLTFNFINKDQVISKDISSVSFYLSGSLDAMWNPDVELLKTKLIGINKGNAPSIFRQDPGVSSALINIFPIWQKSIPNDLSKINIILK